MNVLPMILKIIPGISTQWRELITASSKALGQYQNTRQALLRAITDRQLRLDDIRQGMSYLQSGPVAGILNSIRPGSAQQLHNLFASIVDEGAGRETPQQAGRNAKAPDDTADRRRGNPFPALNQ